MNPKMESWVNRKLSLIAADLYEAGGRAKSKDWDLAVTSV